MSGVANILDAPSLRQKAYQQRAHVFLEGMANTSVKLRAGEHLFVLTDKGIDEGPHIGPGDVAIVTEHFGCWPVVAFAIPAHHVEAWRRIDPEVSAPQMMARVRRFLERLPSSPSVRVGLWPRSMSKRTAAILACLA